MNRCSECSAEMAAGAAACERCGTPQVEIAFEAQDKMPVDITPVSRASAFSRRDLTIVAFALIGTGALTFVLLLTRGASASRALEAAPAPSAIRVTGTSPASGGAPIWSTRDRARWLGAARRSFAADVAARAPVAVWMKNVRPVLVVRCMAQGPEVFVFTDSAARIEPNTTDHTVRITLDDGPEISERWPDSADHDALFAPDAAAWLARISQARTMTFSFTPHNAQPVTAEFHVEGLGDVVAPAARECGFRR